MNIPEVTGGDLAFGTVVGLPDYKKIPDEFKSHYPKDAKIKKCLNFVDDVFFKGVKDIVTTPKEGVDPDKAMRHCLALLRSWRPKHEHKTAGVAYLLDQYFDDLTWTAGEIKKP